MKIMFAFFFCTFFSLHAFSQPAPNSGSIMAAAYKKAAKEKKNVFVIFHASWCGWCKKMDEAMNDESVKNYFTGNYVITHLTVQESDDKKNLENRGADVFLAKYGGKEAGLPFFLIMDKNGKKIGDSFVDKQNLGCPASETEVAAFIDLLKKTSKISPGEITAVTARFRQIDAK